MYTNKFILYGKFLEAIQSFVRQYTFTFFRLLRPCFLHWFEKYFVLLLISLFCSDCLLRQCLIVPLFLQSWSDLGFCQISILLTLIVLAWPNQSIRLSLKFSFSAKTDKTLFYLIIVCNKSLWVLALQLILEFIIKWIRYQGQSVPFWEKNFTTLTKHRQAHPKCRFNNLAMSCKELHLRWLTGLYISAIDTTQS